MAKNIFEISSQSAITIDIIDNLYDMEILYFGPDGNAAILVFLLHRCTLE